MPRRGGASPGPSGSPQNGSAAAPCGARPRPRRDPAGAPPAAMAAGATSERPPRRPASRAVLVIDLAVVEVEAGTGEQPVAPGQQRHQQPDPGQRGDDHPDQAALVVGAAAAARRRAVVVVVAWAPSRPLPGTSTLVSVVNVRRAGVRDRRSGRLVLVLVGLVLGRRRAPLGRRRRPRPGAEAPPRAEAEAPREEEAAAPRAAREPRSSRSPAPVFPHRRRPAPRPARGRRRRPRAPRRATRRPVPGAGASSRPRAGPPLFLCRRASTPTLSAPSRSRCYPACRQRR